MRSSWMPKNTAKHRARALLSTCGCNGAATAQDGFGCWDADSGAIVLTCPICYCLRSIPSAKWSSEGPTMSGGRCSLWPSWRADGFVITGSRGTKGHQGAPRGTWSPKLSKSCDSGDLRKAPSWSSTCKKDQKSSRNKELTTCWGKSKKKT